MPPNIPFWRVLIILSGLGLLLPMIFDVYLPAMPSIARSFGVGDGQIQLTLAAMNFGLAFGQFIYGPLADRYGRRPILIGAMVVFTTTHMAAVYAPDVASLGGLRFVHGLTGAAGAILMRAVIRDLYDGPAYARMIAYTFMTGGIMPIIGPIIGGNLTVTFGWESTMLFMGVVGGIVVLLVWFGLPETGTRDAEALRPRIIGRSIAALCGSRTFVLYTFAGIGPYVGLFAILSDLAPVLIGGMGLTPPDFGLLFAVIMIGNLLASLVAGRLVARLGIDNLIMVGSVFCLVSGFTVFVVTQAGYVGPLAIVLPASGFMIGFALIMPPMYAGALSPFPAMAGRASSLMGIIHYSTATLTALILGLVADGSHRPLVLALLIAGILSILAYFWILRGVRKSG